MKKETLYLDTSVISAYFDKRAKERQEVTIKFWKKILPNYQAHISVVTIEELGNTKNATLKKAFMSLVKGLKVLNTNEEIRKLANVYITKGIFPDRYFDDALHVAVASFYGTSYLASWNFEHLVKIKTRKLVDLVNLLEGYREIEIVSPQEL